MATVKILLKENQPKKDGTYPILIRIIADRTTKYISTGYFAKKNQFTEGMENWVHHHPDAQLINAGIEKKRSTIMEQVYKADIAGAELDVRNIGKNKPTGQMFIKLLLEQQMIFEKRNQVSAFDKLTTRIRNLKAAWGKDIPVSEINKHWVDQYVNDRYAKDASPNTIRKDLSIFSSVLMNSGHTGRNYFKEAQRIIVPVPINREKLTLEEIKLLENTTLYNLDAVARDMFLFSFYTHGMRFQSVAMFTTDMINKGVIRYRMNKGKKIREIIIHPKLQVIIDRYKHDGGHYLFPVLKTEIKDEWQKNTDIDVANAMINVRLKRAAVICGIEKNLTTHIAKHSFASLSLARGVSYAVLKDALGHSDYATTQMYLNSLSDKAVDDAVKGLYD